MFLTRGQEDSHQFSPASFFTQEFNLRKRAQGFQIAIFCFNPDHRKPKTNTYSKGTVVE